MTMKNIINYSKYILPSGSLRTRVVFSATLCMAILMSACDTDFLDRSPFSEVSSATMWTTDNLTDLGISGVYHALRLGITTGGPSGRELYQIDGLGFSSMNRGANALQNGSATPNFGNFTNAWRELYEGIHRANDAIVNMPVISPSPEAKKARYVAEAKFLRAYFYFRLLQLYKGVPIYLEPLPVEQMDRPRNTEAEVWSVIINDLTDAINETNLPSRYQAGSPDFGRVSKSAAYALRGKAYLYMGQWDNAIADFAKVKEAGHTLFPDYRTLFIEANEQNPEMIFSIQHTGVPGFGSTTQFFLGTRSSFGSCWNNILVRDDAVDNYDNLDGSRFNWDDYLPGYTTMEPNKREVFFFRNNLTTAEFNAAVGRGLDMSLYLPDGNEERLLQAYNNRDPRLAASVITPYSSYLGRPIGGIDETFTSRWPFRNENPPVSDLATDTRAFFFYLHRKFVYEGSTQLLNRITGPIDFPLIRYGDVLLMWAEAINEKGFSQEAVDLVNEVRTRAGVGLLNSSPETTVSTQAELRERIRNERRVELMGEGVNYFDEVRWRTLEEKVYYPGSGYRNIWGTMINPYVWTGDYLYNWAIPQVEIERNPKLTQNPGWLN